MARALCRALAPLLLALLVPAWAAAGEEKKPAPEGQKPQAQQFENLDVWAQHVVYEGKENKFTFTNNVTVIKGDLKVDCDRMTGFIDPETRQITDVTALGNVRMVSVATVKIGPDGLPVTTTPSDAWRARAGRADYDLTADRIVLKSVPGAQRPQMWRGAGYAEADTIVFYPDKGTFDLEGSPVIRGELPTGPASTGPAPKPANP
ncbi:MAG: LptA/OstA family protein [Candidatus Brocadiia bacterium]